MSEIIDKNTLKALSANTRQNIVKLLAKRPYTASELSKILNKHVTTVTEHLNTLEKTGLIKRKDSSNKWIYYALSNKGEKMFKPFYYSWVIVFSLSIISLFIGIQQLLSTQFIARSFMVAENEAAEAVEAIDTGLIIGIVFICLSIIGFFYLLIKKRK